VTDLLEENQRALAGELERVASNLAAHAEGREPAAAPARASSPALERVVDAFGLSPFERDVLLLCAGVELEAQFAGVCACAGGDERLRRPTFGLALAALPGAHWSALAPASPLRRWHLVELDGGETIATSPLRIAERVLHHLTGLDYLDQRLAGLIEPVAAPASVATSQERACARVAAAFRDPVSARVVLLCGAEPDTRRAVAAAGLASAGLRLHAIPADEVPAQAAERESLARLWEREAILGRSGLLIEVDDGAEPDIHGRAAAFADAAALGIVVGGREPVRLRRRLGVRVDVARPSAGEQRRLWEEALGESAASLNGSLDALVSQFDLGADAIAAAAAQLEFEPREVASELWEACRAYARPRLDDLAQRIEAQADWNDLVVPPAQREILAQIVVHVRGRARVHEAWGFARKSARGLGIGVLFEGPSGTGKTMAAEVLAGDLELDLYRIDLSQVVSKYIGETEKNLKRVFDAAETGGAILLFDEADALFGKRSEVRDSHDRYANIEVSYLLQRMEAYRGLAILTTNAKDAIDQAFMRRLRFVVRFPFPDAAGRAEIWRRVFPAETPTAGLDPDVLSGLNMAGGNIRNIALAAAFLAAEAGESVRMSHVAEAAQREFLKLGRPLTDTEVRAWT